MKYYRWTQEGSADDWIPGIAWYLQIKLIGYDKRDLMVGHFLQNWDENTTAYYEEEVDHTDYPFTNEDIPVYSPRLHNVMDRLRMEEIQYLPLRVKHIKSGNEIEGYQIANYLSVIDCLDRNHSEYQIWTKDNLLFWEKRPHLLGTFRDVKKVVLDLKKIGQARLFRLWGWESMVIVREDVKKAIENDGISGCLFIELEP